MKKKLALIILTALSLTLLAACGGNNNDTTTPPADTNVEADDTADEPADETEEEDVAEEAAIPGDVTELTFAMWDEGQMPVFQDILNEFETQNPDITVELQLVPWSQYWINLDAALGAGTAADVFWMNSFLPRYAEAGLLSSLDEFIARDGIDMNDYVASTLRLTSHNGTQYAMPKGLDTVVVVYNREMFETYGVDTPSEGWTWDDMISIAEELRANMDAEGSDLFPILMELSPQPSYINFIQQNGGFILSEDGRTAGFDQPGTVTAYQNVLDLMDANLMPSATVLADTVALDLFISQRGAMLFVGTWNAATLDSSSIGPDLGTIAMPAQADGNMSVIAGLGFAVNAFSEHQDAAWRLASFLSGEDSNRMQAEAGIDIPALISAQHYYHLDHIDTNVIFTVTETGFSFPMSPTLSEWWPDVNEISAQIFAGIVTPEEGTSRLQGIIQPILDAQ